MLEATDQLVKLIMEDLIMYIDLEFRRPYDSVFNSLVIPTHCSSNTEQVLLLSKVIDWHP